MINPKKFFINKMNSRITKMIFSMLLILALFKSILTNECERKLYDACKETLDSTIYARQYQIHLSCLRVFFKSWCKNNKYILAANIDCEENHSEICRYTSENSRVFLIRHHYDMAEQVNCADVNSLDSQFDNYINNTYYDRDVLGYFYNICYNDTTNTRCKSAKTTCVDAAREKCLELVKSDCEYRKGFLDLTTCNVKFEEFNPKKDI